MLVSRVNVTFHDSDRVVTEDFRERRQVDPLLGHACRKGVHQSVKNKIQRDTVGLRLLAETIMSVVHLGDVLARIPRRREDPRRRTGHPLGKDPAALRSEIQLSRRSAGLSSSDVHPPTLQIDVRLRERRNLVRPWSLIEHQAPEIMQVSMHRNAGEISNISTPFETS
jgi:hypothetical protein